jgi:hypothetical protein
MSAMSSLLRFWSVSLSALAALLAAAGEARAQIVTSGELVLRDFGGDPAILDVTIDRITFYAAAGTTINFDGLCWESPFTETGDLNGDGEITWTDFQMTLLDGTGQILVRHDDGLSGAAGLGNDGSITRFDGNFTYTFVDESTYVLAVGSTLPDFRLFSQVEALQGYRLDFARPGISFGQGQQHGDWQVTFNVLAGSVSDIVVDTLGYPATPNPNSPPQVTCAVDTDTLWSPDQRLVNVGLGFDVSDDADAAPAVNMFVYSNEGGTDDVRFGAEGLELRAERRGNGDGRAYLIVIVATDSAGATGFDCCTVVVPHDASDASEALVALEADLAEVMCSEAGAPPEGYSLIGSMSVP